METSDIHAESCGLSCWKPKWLQRFATPILFVISTCTLTFSDAVYFGVLGGITTSLETRYKLSATQLGFLFTADTIGLVLVLLFVAYYGGHPSRNRPRWIAWGNVISVIGTVVFILPQFINDPFNSQQVSELEEKSTPICHNDELNELNNNNIFNSTCLENDFQLHLSRRDDIAYYLLVFGVFLMGVGFAPVRPLAVSYIDDNAPKKAGLFFGIIESMYGIGTIFGLLITAVLLDIWVDFYRSDARELKPGDPGWVGAWWAAISIAGALFLFSTIPYFCFPKRLPRKREVTTEATTDDLQMTFNKDDLIDSNIKSSDTVGGDNQSTSLLDLLHSVCRLLQNPAFVALCLASIFETFMAGSYILFPKYFEEQFSLSPADANFIIAIGPVPGIFVGSILGGYLIKRFKMDAIGASKMAVVCTTISVLLGIAMLCTGCKNPDFAGVSTAHHANDGSGLTVQSQCNANCGCNTEEFVPVCGDDNFTYFSPCHAGCVHALNETIYTNCSCLSTEFSHEEYMTSTYVGACAMSCEALIPFTILFVIFAVVLSIFPISRIFITIRCVDPTDKSLAIGVSKFLTYVFGAIPSTILIGAIVDTACTVWQVDTCGTRGACWIYDITKYRHYYMGFNVALASLTCLCYIVTWYFLKRRQNDINEDNDHVDKEANAQMYNQNLK